MPRTLDGKVITPEEWAKALEALRKETGRNDITRAEVIARVGGAEPIATMTEPVVVGPEVPKEVEEEDGVTIEIAEGADSIDIPCPKATIRRGDLNRFGDPWPDWIFTGFAQPVKFAASTLLSLLTEEIAGKRNLTIQELALALRNVTMSFRELASAPLDFRYTYLWCKGYLEDWCGIYGDSYDMREYEFLYCLDGPKPRSCKLWRRLQAEQADTLQYLQGKVEDLLELIDQLEKCTTDGAFLSSWEIEKGKQGPVTVPYASSGFGWWEPVFHAAIEGYGRQWDKKAQEGVLNPYQ